MALAPVVETAAGRVSGVAADGVERFLGIPYAIPRRLAPPDGHGPAWAGVRDGTAFGPPAPQARYSRSELLHGVPPSGSEADCLTLNVWRPTGEASLPVIVWLHGGGFVSGHSGAPCYDATALARDGHVVVVTLNYRLGSLGWLAHPDLREDPAGPCANWGLLDQAAALRWVHCSISAFGGDPTNVTLAGHSAGALSALLLSAMPSARGLFHRLIAQSPAVRIPRLEAASRWAKAVAHEILGSDVAPDALRTCAAERIIAADLVVASAGHGSAGLTPVCPVIDGASVVQTVLEAAAKGVDAPVPALVGTTRDEATLFVRFGRAPRGQTAAELAERIQRLRPLVDVAEVIRRYADHLRGTGQPDTATDVWIAAFGDATFRGPLLAWADRRLGRATTYVYRYGHASPIAGLGATHAVEVPLVFGSHFLGDLPAFVGRGPDVDVLSRDVIRAWTAFAATGVPVQPDGRDWPQYDETRSHVFIDVGSWRTERVQPEVTSIWR